MITRNTTVMLTCTIQDIPYGASGSVVHIENRMVWVEFDAIGARFVPLVYLAEKAFEPGLFHGTGAADGHGNVVAWFDTPPPAGWTRCP